MTKKRNPIGQSGLVHLLDVGLGNHLSQPTSLELWGDSQRVDSDRPTALLVSNVGWLPSAGAPVGGEGHVPIRDGLTDASRRNNVGQQDADGPVGATCLDGLGVLERLNGPALELARDHGAEDAETQLGTRRQAIR